MGGEEERRHKILTGRSMTTYFYRAWPTKVSNDHDSRGSTLTRQSFTHTRPMPRFATGG